MTTFEPADFKRLLTHINSKHMKKAQQTLSKAPMLIACVLYSQTVAYSTVTLNSGGATTLEVVARDSTVSLANTITDLQPTSLRYTGSADAVIGTSSSHADFTLSSTSFLISSFGARNGHIDSRANVQPTIFFSVTEDTPYWLAGLFNVDDPGSTGKYLEFGAALKDLTGSSVLYETFQSSFGAPDQTFVLGGATGNVNNIITGSPTGMLLAGHDYSLNYGSSIYAADSGDPASFTGSFEMRFKSVPEGGSTALLLGTGILGMLGLASKVRAV
jgi:hypothetical protein